MAINSFATALQPIIQSGYLEHEFKAALRSKLAYRSVADRESFNSGIGETLTKTRPGLLPTVTVPLNGATANTTVSGGISVLDNGLTLSQWAVEQFTITLQEWAGTMNLNTVGEMVGVVKQFGQNALALAEQAARSLEEQARAVLFAAYMGGNTRVSTTLGSAGTAVVVDDIRGFMSNPVNGVMASVSAGNPVNVVIGSGTYSLIGAVAAGTNVSTAPGGVSGTLTFATPVSVADGTAGNAVVVATAPSIIRPSGRTTSAALQATDVLTMANLLDAKAKLELNAVPRIDGFYHIFLDPVSARQLFADPDFKLLFQGATAESAAFRNGQMADPFLGLRFFPTTEAYTQAHPTIAGATIRRPIIAGRGALIEGNFAGMTNHDTGTALHDMIVVDGVALITREPMDRLGQVIAQSWYSILGWCAPTDMGTNPSTIPTATNSAYKRAVVLEHVG